MPTAKARMYVTLTPATRAALDRFTAATGIASSQFAAQILDGSVPVIDATTEAFKIAKRSPAAAASRMSEVLGQAMVAAAQEKLELDDAAVTKPLRKRPARD